MHLVGKKGVRGRDANLEVVHISREGDLNWWCNTLLPQAAELAGRVNLCPESRHVESVFCANGRNALLAWSSHHGVPARESQVEINTGLDLLG